MPKGSKAGVRKECDACSEQIPVACKTCPECNHELIPERKDSASLHGNDVASLGLVEDLSDLDSDRVEKRRSVRAKRDKPDYYDALDYDSKRAKAIKNGGAGTPKRVAGFGSRVSPGGKSRRHVGYSSFQQTRATLAWRKEDDEDLARRKGKKPNGSKKDEVEESFDYIEEIPPEKVFSCAVGLAEINRKLGIVMWKPPVL